MIRILLIEPLAVVRESLALAFAATGDMERRCCSSNREGSELLKGSSGQFDVVLLHQRTGGEKADELLAITNQNGLKGRVLIITPWRAIWSSGDWAASGWPASSTNKDPW